MVKSILERMKDKAKQYLNNKTSIEGYSIDIDTQYIIVHEHFRLASIGFGVPHDFWNLGEAIFDFWFDILKSNNITVVSKNKDKLRIAIYAEMKCEPTEDNMKVHINIMELLEKPFRFIDLFAGIGGFHIAMHHVGGKCVFASEWDKNARLSYEANFKELEPNLF